MNSKKKSTVTRTLDQLVADFQASAGSFLAFHGTLTGKERSLFRGWLAGMRQPAA
jgi:hypothetical protein